MFFPYKDVLTLNREIKNHSWIGGWEENNDVYLYRRDAYGVRIKTKIPNVPKYFCIEKKHLQEVKERIENWKNAEFIKSGKVDDRYIYLITNFVGKKSVWNDFLQSLHDIGIEPLEGDVSRIQRLVIDCDIKITNPNGEFHPRVAFWDLETDDSVPEIRLGKDRILSCGIKELDTGNEFFYVLENDSDEAEKKLITDIFTKLVSYDVIVSFNGFGFDEPYLEGRLDYHRIDRNKWRYISKIDMYNQFERQGTFLEFETKDKKLDTISNKVLGRGKINHGYKIRELWENNRDLLKEYNLEDIRLLFDLENKLKTCNLVMSMMSFAGIPYNLSHSPMRLVESFLLRLAARKRENNILDYRFPTAYYLPEHNTGGGGAWTRNSLSSDRRKSRKEELEEMGVEVDEITGGYVMESQPIFAKSVASFDFSSLYPSVIMAFNICYSTLLKGNDLLDTTIPRNQTPNGCYYRTDYNGLMPDGVEFLLNERKRIRAEMAKETDEKTKTSLDILQKSVKILANSFYGVSGLWGSRLFSADIGNSVTSFGRFALPLGEEYFNASGRKVVVQDTDSMYVTLKDGDDLQKLMNDYISLLRETIKTKYNTYRPDVLNMTYEKFFDTILVIKKKMYAGMVSISDGKTLDKPKLIIKGLKLKKSDTCQWAADSAKQLLTDVLSGKYSYDHFERFIECKQNDLVSGKIPLPNLRISSRLGKDVKDYVAENPLVYVKIAKRMQKLGLPVTSHQTINYYITDGVTPMQGIGEEEINGEVELDMVYYWNVGFLQIVSPILEVAFPEINWDKYKYPKRIKKYNFFQLKVKYENI